ncbi:thioredoxin family protein [Propioniciclava flava]
MEIILQYFNGCPNWEVLDQRLAEVVNDRSDVRVIRQLVETPEDAVRLGFHGSPTVLVNGIDPFADERTHVGLACRMFRTPAGIAGSPTVEQLREAISGPGADV